MIKIINFLLKFKRKLVVYVILVAGGLSIVGLAYWYIHSLRTQVNILRQNNILLESSVNEQKEVIGVLEANTSHIIDNTTRLSDRLRENNEEYEDTVKSIDSKRGLLSEKAKQNPDKVANDLTVDLANILRQFEQTTTDRK